MELSKQNFLFGLHSRRHEGLAAPTACDDNAHAVLAQWFPETAGSSLEFLSRGSKTYHIFFITDRAWSMITNYFGFVRSYSSYATFINFRQFEIFSGYCYSYVRL